MRRVEHWENALEQGKHVARVMTGKKVSFEYLPYFFSDIFDLSYDYFGDNEGATGSVSRGNLKSGDFSYWWFKEDILVAAFVMSSRPEKEKTLAREWISGKTKINPELLGDNDMELDDMVKHQG